MPWTRESAIDRLSSLVLEELTSSGGGFKSKRLYCSWMRLGRDECTYYLQHVLGQEALGGRRVTVNTEWAIAFGVGRFAGLSGRLHFGGIREAIVTLLGITKNTPPILHSRVVGLRTDLEEVFISSSSDVLEVLFPGISDLHKKLAKLQIRYEDTGDLDQMRRDWLS